MNDDLQRKALLDLLVEFLDTTEGQPSASRATIILAIIDKAKTMYFEYSNSQDGVLASD